MVAKSMFDELRFRFAIWQNDRANRKAWKRHDKRLGDARRRKASRDELAEISADEQYIVQENEDEILRLVTHHLLKQADKLLIPRPEFKEGDTFVVSQIRVTIYLTQC